MAVAVIARKRIRPFEWRKSWLICALWLAVCLAGSYWAMSYEFRPGRLGSHQLHWPSASALKPASGKMTVVAFIHPRCVCSKATVKQLIRTLTAHPDAALIVSIFVPADFTDKQVWEEGEYVKMIRAALPGAQIIFDNDGAEARRFDAPTSGIILAYNRNAQEVFRGGITDRRGGEGDNPGLRALAGVLTTGKQGSLFSARVFGCPLMAQKGFRGGRAK